MNEKQITRINGVEILTVERYGERLRAHQTNLHGSRD